MSRGLLFAAAPETEMIKPLRCQGYRISEWGRGKRKGCFY